MKEKIDVQKPDDLGLDISDLRYFLGVSNELKGSVWMPNRSASITGQSHRPVTTCQ